MKEKGARMKKSDFFALTTFKQVKHFRVWALVRSMRAVCRRWCGSMLAVCRRWCGSMRAVCRRWCGSIRAEGWFVHSHIILSIQTHVVSVVTASCVFPLDTSVWCVRRAIASPSVHAY